MTSLLPVSHAIAFHQCCYHLIAKAHFGGGALTRWSRHAFNSCQTKAPPFQLQRDSPLAVLKMCCGFVFHQSLSWRSKACHHTNVYFWCSTGGNKPTEFLTVLNKSTNRHRGLWTSLECLWTTGEWSMALVGVACFPSVADSCFCVHVLNTNKEARVWQSTADAGTVLQMRQMENRCWRKRRLGPKSPETFLKSFSNAASSCEPLLTPLPRKEHHEWHAGVAGALINRCKCHVDKWQTVGNQHGMYTSRVQDTRTICSCHQRHGKTADHLLVNPRLMPPTIKSQHIFPLKDKAGDSISFIINKSHEKTKSCNNYILLTSSVSVA